MDTGTDQKDAAWRVIREPARVAAEALALLGLARRNITVFAPQLEPALFNTAAAERALASFAISHRHSRARFLVEDAEQAVRDNDRLVHLCRRLSDFFELRRVSEDHAGLRELFLLVDGRACLHQRELSRPEFIVDHRSRHVINELMQRFMRMWDHSEPIPYVRTTGL